MQLKASANLIQFLDGVKKCSGEVTFNTSEGDILNLKSLLSQYLFAAMVGNEKLLTTGKILCENPDDYRFLLPYCDEDVPTAG